MHESLFAHQRALDRKSLLSYAGELELDVARFSDELDAGVHRPRIERDIQSGLERNIQSTPTFFINNKLFEGSWDPGHMIKALERAARLAKRDR
jgi:protein-disulfide isomerase